MLTRHPEALLVGGAVRDLLLGAEPREFDVVVAGDPRAVAEELGAISSEHERFGTFTVQSAGLPIDVARARREHYAEPGALPDVEPASLAADLTRRDFTINALTLAPDGTLGGAGGALEDLTARRLRVFHDRSFVDDPTRLWRLVRYAVRLGLLPEPHTGSLAHDAVRSGALLTVSGERLAAELRLALTEPDPAATLHAAKQLALVTGLKIDPGLVAQALALAPAGADRGLVVLGSCLPRADWGTEFAFTARERHLLDRCASLEPLPAVPPAVPSELVTLVDGEPDEAVAVAAARGSAASGRQWFSTWSRQRPVIDGDDLLATGLREGPEIGRILRATRLAIVDGGIEPGRESELAFALGLAAAGLDDAG